MIDFDSIRAAHPLLDIAARYVDPRKRGSVHRSLCPWHADSTQPGNLEFFRSPTDGFGRFRCWVCGVRGDVIDFVAEIERVDKKEAIRRLTGGELPEMGAFRPAPVPDEDEAEAWTPVVPAPAHAPAYDPARTYNPRRGRLVRYQPTRLDTYRGPGGEILCHVVRLEFEDGQKLCPTITWCRGPDGQEAWAAKRMRAPYPLMGCDSLAQKPGATVLVVEGEKAREAAARELPMYAVITFLGGVEAVKHADVTPLRGRSLIVWPDADAPGVRAMEELVKRCAS
jgi:hypothetical protein